MEKYAASEKVQGLLGMLLEQAQQHALLVLDVDGKILKWLAGAGEIFGYGQEIVGLNASVLFTPEDVAMGLPEHELVTARETGKAEDDRWMQRKDGSHIWVVGITYALRDSSGKLAGYGKLMRDMTHLKAQISTLESRIQGYRYARRRKSGVPHSWGHWHTSWRMYSWRSG